jgi:hypothetical protein
MPGYAVATISRLARLSTHQAARSEATHSPATLWSAATDVNRPTPGPAQRRRKKRTACDENADLIPTSSTSGQLEHRRAVY